VITVRNRLVPALVAVRVIALGGGGVPAGMRLIDRDHVLVDVVLVRVMQVPVVHVVDVIVVAHGGVPAVRSMLVSVCAFMDRMSHTPTLDRRLRLRKRRTQPRKHLTKPFWNSDAPKLRRLRLVSFQALRLACGPWICRAAAMTPFRPTPLVPWRIQTI
jgi:hypothetical protein